MQAASVSHREIRLQIEQRTVPRLSGKQETTCPVMANGHDLGTDNLLGRLWRQGPMTPLRERTSCLDPDGWVGASAEGAEQPKTLKMAGVFEMLASAQWTTKETEN
jgi:hypothetical protein